MRLNRHALRQWSARAIVVAVAFAGVTAGTTALATTASAAKPSPARLCADHGGVDVIRQTYVVCNDGEMFDLD